MKIPFELHKMGRSKLLEKFAAAGKNGVILLEGGKQMTQYDSDTEIVFRQDSWFNYTFGVKEPGMFGALSTRTGKTTLFIPKLSPEWAIWCGEIYPPSYFQKLYEMDEVLYIDDMNAWVAQELAHVGDSQVYLLHGVNSDSGLYAHSAEFESRQALQAAGKIDMDTLFPLLTECRVFKTPMEVEAMRYVAYVASNAHVSIMRSINEMSFEYDLEAKFKYEIYRNGGCRHAAYTAICACGPNNAVLHYGHGGAPNDRSLQRTDLALLDMGAEYHGYVSDITCSFPIAGTFTVDQRAIFEGVYNAQGAVMRMMAPGVSWVDCHRAAEREVLAALIKVGVLHNGTVEEMLAADVCTVFMPHGLGHFIGCDTHDVGGYGVGSPARLPGFGVGKLRTGRILEAGMVLTNEPGCYFIDALLDRALADPTKARFFNNDVLPRFRRSGGVRLEDVVLVTAEGVENLTTCPRTVGEVESVMAGGAWPPVADAAPHLKRRWTKLHSQGECMEDIHVPKA